MRKLRVRKPNNWWKTKLTPTYSTTRSERSVDRQRAEIRPLRLGLSGRQIHEQTGVDCDHEVGDGLFRKHWKLTLASVQRLPRIYSEAAIMLCGSHTAKTFVCRPSTRKIDHRGVRIRSKAETFITTLKGPVKNSRFRPRPCNNYVTMISAVLRSK